MPSGSSAESTSISVAIARDPALVRTVRLIAAAFSRRSGLHEELVEEIRLAVGEAVGLMVGESEPAPGSSTRVSVTMTLSSDRLAVEVSTTDRVIADDRSAAWDGVAPWALLRGLIDDFALVTDDDRTAVTMSWPAAAQDG